MSWGSTLPNRKKPMNRTGFKKSIPPWIKKMADDKIAKKGDSYIVRKGNVVKKRSTLKKQSKSLRRRMSEYYPLSKQFLIDNPACQICPCRGMGAAPSTEVHHSRGRIGRLLTDVRFFIASCRGCREVPHSNPKWAREHGLLSTASEWNVYPD